MIRILQLCNRVPWPPNDGGAIAMLNMTKGFYGLGQELHLLCLNTRKHHINEPDLPPLFKSLASFKTVDINTGINPIGAFMNLVFTRKSYHISRFYSKEFEKELIKTLKSQDFDIIQIEGLHLCLYIDAIRQYSHAKISLRAHNLEYLIWERLADSEGNQLKRMYLNILTKRLLNFEANAVKKVDFLIPITHADAELFGEMEAKAAIFVSPAGLDMQDYVIDKSKREWPGLFHLGALNWMPNVQGIEWFLKEIWPKLHSAFPKLKFYIAGRNMPGWLKKLDRVGVVAIGEVDNAVDFMNSKSIMVVPLLSGSGMRIKIIEGMALGKTIVSTTIGAEGIDYEDETNILIADDPEEFVSAIKKCINNPEMANRLGKNARLLAEKEYSNSSLVGKLVEFYEEKIKKSSPSFPGEMPVVDNNGAF